MAADAATTIDVVIPCYNVARFLGQALDSVFAQGLPGLQVILIDDGSSDDCASVARAYGDRVQLHRQANSGIAAARNVGINKSRGDWLAFLDADDIWTAGSLAARLQHFEKAPQTDIVFGRLEQFHSAELDDAARLRLPFDPTPADARFAGTLLARRASFMRAGLFDTRLKVGEMIEWVSRAQAVPLVIDQIQHISMRRRIHGNNTMLRQAPGHGDYLRALKASIDSKRARQSVSRPTPGAA
jgi:glycosyltransferase involved in cell wall biosynthesis